MLMNIDRWLNYSKQKQIQRGDHSKRILAELTHMTPRQFRRCMKKARKNTDHSLGLW